MTTEQYRESLKAAGAKFPVADWLLDLKRCVDAAVMCSLVPMGDYKETPIPHADARVADFGIILPEQYREREHHQE